MLAREGCTHLPKRDLRYSPGSRSQLPLVPIPPADATILRQQDSMGSTAPVLETVLP